MDYDKPMTEAEITQAVNEILYYSDRQIMLDNGEEIKGEHKKPEAMLWLAAELEKGGPFDDYKLPDNAKRILDGMEKQRKAEGWEVSR